MSASLPAAKSSPSPDERAALKRVIAERGLCGLANDTKWDEFIAGMRARQDWRPSDCYRCMDGPPSSWDVEWFYHLPFPLFSVEWFDVSFMQKSRRGMLVPPLVTDHSPWIEEWLQRVGLEYRKGTMIRIFGYRPKNVEWFEA
jgi:hypothetical protein